MSVLDDGGDFTKPIRNLLAFWSIFVFNGISFRLQVAGHGSHDSKQAILTNRNGCILKPVQAPPRGHRYIDR